MVLCCLLGVLRLWNWGWNRNTGSRSCVVFRKTELWHFPLMHPLLPPPTTSWWGVQGQYRAGHLCFESAVLQLRDNVASGVDNGWMLHMNRERDVTSSSLTHCMEKWLQWSHRAHLSMLIRSPSSCWNTWKKTYVIFFTSLTLRGQFVLDELLTDSNSRVEWAAVRLWLCYVFSSFTACFLAGQ